MCSCSAARLRIRVRLIPIDWRRNLTAMDVVAAIKEQNQQVAAGQISQPPVAGKPENQFTLTTLGRLDEPEQFANIILRTTPDGRVLALKTLAMSSLARRRTSKTRSTLTDPGRRRLPVARRQRSRHGGTPPQENEGAGKVVSGRTRIQNRLRHYAVRQRIHRRGCQNAHRGDHPGGHRRADFPAKLGSTIIPLVAVPVAIIGTFAVMAAVGFSLNNLTLFGLVLAIGIVVDDAIVVVEAVEHHIEEGLLPKQAAFKAMEEVSGCDRRRFGAVGGVRSLYVH